MEEPRKITELDEAGQLASTDLYVIEQGTGTRKINTLRNSREGYGLLHKRETFISTDGQTIFSLLEIPSFVYDFQLNGVSQDLENDIFIVNNNVNWVNNLFTLDVGDKITIKYII